MNGRRGRGERRARILGALLCLLGSGCLPDDTRPEPGSVLTTMTGSEAARNSVVTEDGWTLTFGRALLNVGPMQLGDECQKYAEYSEPGYDRILDVTRDGAQKVSIMFGLGRCDIDFATTPPSGDAVRGAGVTEADKAALRTPGSDRFVTNDGVVLHLEGAGERAGRRVSFAWDIRQRLFFKKCVVSVKGMEQAGLDLRGGTDLEVDLLAEVEALFRDDVARDGARLRFDPFASADARGDRDGVVTLDELRSVTLQELRTDGAYGVGDAEDTVASLDAYIYRVLWPTFLRYRGTGECSVALVED